MGELPPYIQLRPDRLGAGVLRALLEAEFSLRRAGQRRRLAINLTALAGLPLMVAILWPAVLGAAASSLAADAWAALALLSLGLGYDEVTVWRQRNQILAARPKDSDHGSAR